jgi:putative thioredoxin
MAGAVDLAAVQARAEAAARAAEAPAPTAGQYVVDVTEASFQAEVLDRSFQVPVVIAVHSGRSPASAQIAPVLESLAAEAGGGWVLAVVDADTSPGIAQALRVQVVPTVFAVIGGQLVPGFEGALPDEQLRAFIAAVVQAGREAGLSAVPAAGDDEAEALDEPDDPRFVAAEDALIEGDYPLATERYHAILAAEPANARAQLALLQVGLLQRVEQADPAVAARADADPADLSAALAAADLAIAGGDVDAALRRLLTLLGQVGGEEREQARLRLVEYFDMLGPDDPRVAPARREMARVLF